MNASNLTHSC